MSLGHGPRLVTQGLVFAYDMPTDGASSTNKSWKGAPVTNVVANTDLDTGWSQNYNTSIQWNDYPPPNGINSQVVSFIDADGNGSGYWYSYGDYATQQPDTTYAISIWCRTIGSDWTIRAYTADNSETGRQNTNNVTIPGDGKWHRAEFNPITTPSNTQSDSLSFIFPSIPPGQRCWLCAPQMTATSYHVPFVNGTRSNTQALLDWTGNHTITANSLTYESDGTFSFNGSSNYMSVSGSSDWAFGSNGSIEQWVYPTNSTGNDRLWCVNNNSTSIDAYLNGSTYNLYYHGSAANGGTLTPNVWNHVCVTYTGGVIQAYVNGIAATMGGTTTGYNITNSATLYIGRYVSTGYELYGKIGNMKIYNKGLTATEVAQNFNALKGRYGL